VFSGHVDGGHQMFEAKFQGKVVNGNPDNLRLVINWLLAEAATHLIQN
jgi:hypothetical protein